MGFIDRGQTFIRLALCAGALLLSGCAGSPPSNLGISEGRLAPCPSSPNCVSSFASDEEHAVSPWSYQGSQAAAQQKLVEILNATDNATVIVNEPNYIRAEFESSLMGFVDDVEFVIEARQIHVRSASRLGYSDLGANRKRIENLQSQFLPCCE